ncbi:Mfa1 family fimbria major subunit [Prevotella sp.]|uniref:Mfa1 family fimbria major subunit n=1 Tax=Prevotella sp. TaxID=59823 RepID=UPI004025074A
MKNVKNLFGMAVMATALVGCSSNDNLTPNANEGADKTGEAYASFKINLPTTSGTRATEGEPSFNGGNANEYAVNDATLLVFKKVTESGKDVYRYQEAVDLGNMEPWTKKDPANGGITTTAKMTAKLNKASVGSEDYYALILLNNNYNAGASTAKIKYPADNQSFSDWSKDAGNATPANYLNHDNGFFMANAPKYVANGEPQTLVKISAIYASKQQAENSTATTVYVERGLAKVSLAEGSKKHVDILAGNYKDDKVDITGWTLDVTNTKTFPVHVTEGLTDSYADIWKTGVTPGLKHSANVNRFFDSTLDEFNRVYWGIDPNYSNAFSSVVACKGEFTMATTAFFQKGEDAKKPQYCLENTFDIDHMVQGQTTRVLFSATYTPDGFTAGDTFYKMGNSSQLWNAAKVEAQIKAKAMEVLSETDEAKVTVTLAAPANNLTKAGVHLVAAANVQHNSVNISDGDALKINAKLGFKKATTTDAAVGLSTFESGVSYYIARVKHFGNLTPWNPGDDVYNSSNIDWLGRYGVLRNNWYELSVSSVSGPGYPDIPEVKPTVPDDENDQYINVEVKILDWAKRSQQVEL